MAEEMLFVEAVDDGSIEVLQSGPSSGCFSLEDLASTEGDPFENRRDISEMKQLIANLQKKLRYKDKETIEEELDYLKPRKNFGALFEGEVGNIAKVVETPKMACASIRDVAAEALDYCKKAMKTAEKGEPAFKRPFEILEDVLPVFLVACTISKENIELSSVPTEALGDYEASKAAMKKCQSEFDMDGREEMQKESVIHLDKALTSAKEDAERMKTKLKKEAELERMRLNRASKEDVTMLVESETRDLWDKLKSCTNDIQEIEKAKEEQKERMQNATKIFDGRIKSNNLKLGLNRSRQEELQKQLVALKKEEEKVLNNITFEKEVQERAKQWDGRINDSLLAMQKDIETIEAKVAITEMVIQDVFSSSKLLLDVSIDTQRKHEDHLKKLEIEALTRHRRVLATAIVDLMLESNNADANVEDYKNRMQELHQTMSQAAKRGQAVIVKKAKEDLKIFQDECKKEKEAKEMLDTRLKNLRQLSEDVGKELADHGVGMETIEELCKEEKVL